MAATLVLLHEDRLFYAELKPGEELTIGSHKKDHIQLAEFKPAQISVKWKTGGICVQAKKAYDFSRENVPLDTTIMLDRQTRTALYICSEATQSEQIIRLDYDCVLKFGRADSNDVILRLPFVSGTHFVLKNEAGSTRIEDCNSTNGLYLNGQRVKIAKMKSGDVLSILSLRIRLLNGELHFFNAGDALTIRAPEETTGASQLHAKGQRARLSYRRSPRMMEQLPDEDIVLAAPPSKGQKYEKGRGLFASLAGSGAMFAASMLTTAASPALLAARAASMVSPVTSAAASGGANKKRKKSLAQYEAQRREKYGAYIEDQKARIESVAKVQREILNRENPSPAECGNILYGLKRSLWERTPGDRDFLDVRLGMGYEDLCVSVKSRADANGFQMEDDEVRELSEQIVEETRIVDGVPARLSLQSYATVGLVGARQRVLRLVRNMLIELTVSHFYEDVRIVGLFGEEERSFWEALRWLPHVWDEHRQFRYLAFDRKDAHALCEMLQDELKSRRSAQRDGGAHGPHYLLLLGTKELIEREPILEELLQNDPALGVTTLFLFDELYLLPHDCRYIVDVDHGPCAFDSREANRKKYFTPDAPVSDADFDRFARRMSAVEVERAAKTAALPDGVTLLQGYGVRTVEELNIFERWQSAVPYKSLAAPIGVMRGGKTFFMDIHENRFGPHGLVAGTTGSGKSELLQTWILSMAMNFHPHDVCFVLIDYKGGGMANLLEPLPHVVGKITNIGANIGRSLISLKSENERRQRIFEQYGVSHIDKYHRLYREGIADELLPDLVIVADEFAELKKAEPEFMSELVAIARIGRSLGVHLVLATQKPGGVVDEQIQSNARFRLCLKVQNVGDSREMIKRPDAARLTQAGRCYIRVGEDEYFDIFQTYWSGAPYYGAARGEQTGANAVRIVELNGRRVKPAQTEKKRSKSEQDELTAVVRHICAVAAEHGIESPRGPWLPELPEELTLEQLGVPGGFDGAQWGARPRWLTVPIGMYDAPREQKQGVQLLDLAANGHCGIFGAPGTGKTTLLKELALAFGTYYTPEDVNLYILDFGGWGMSVFSELPHVGGVVLDGEDEKLRKLEQLLRQEIEERKRIFLKNAVGSLAAYRETVSERLPAIVLLIDNIVPLFGQYPDSEELLAMLARDGATYGIYLIYTANSSTGVRYKVQQNVRGAIAFELTDKGDYAGLVGRIDGGALPKNAGRAFFKGKPPVVFQAALPTGGETDQERTLRLRETIARQAACWNGLRARPIPVMPEQVAMRQMAQAYTVRTRLPVGIDWEHIQTAYIDLAEQYSMLISGAIRSGKSRMLKNLGALIAERFPQTRLYVLDGRGGALAELKERAARYVQVDGENAATELFDELVEELNVRKRAQNQARGEAGDAFDEDAFLADYPMLCILIDDLKEFVDTVSDASRNAMERICRLAQKLGVMVLAAGRMADIAKYNEIESLTRVIVGNQKGLCLGGTPAQYGFFRNELKYAEKEQAVEEGDGLLFDQGSCLRVKPFEEGTETE